ncbi:uncharacterized protein LOC126590398 [Malus sylvestris]|uniref:uncharacterized protein LOC126590398 n=1 Tax=Malus sylvestris TaxID=3752 RepID=UPI0021AC4CB2|nr:uncharacterized protein LOC126590398 [Malus sylvestris]
MERYFKRKSTEDNISPSTTDIPESSNENNIESILANLPGDPGLRLRISEYDPNIRDQVRRAYLQRELVQPRTHQFPYTSFAGVQRCFNPKWFDDFPTWLEYSISKNVVFCRSCYLFKLEIPDQAGNDNFTSKGFHNWKKKCRLRVHVGGPNSAHNQALLHCEALMNQNQHIQTIVHKQSDQARIDYRTRLNASLDCIRFLLRQGLAFRGHDESEDSSNKSNFLELLKFLADHNEGIKDVVFKNAPENLKLTSPDIQKDLVYAAACETTNTIMFDIGDDAFFSVLVDESRDISVKEQMVVVLRYVNTNGQVVERFVGIKHVPNTTAISLKEAIDQFFSINGLSISRLRGQGYDGASNMQARGRSRRRVEKLTNLHHYHVDLFIDVIDKQLQELNNRFNETSTELLLCVACLSPDDSFSAFDIEKLVRLAKFYPKDFSDMELTLLEDELKNYIFDMRLHNEFSTLKGINNLAQKLVETKRDRQYPLVYLLVKLALILPVATASVERAFSVMKIVKNPHRNRMGDQWLNDSLVVYIEKDVYDSISNDVVIRCFQNMRTRRGQL